MKYSLTLLSVLGLNLGLTLAQDAQMLIAVGFPSCAVPCIQAGNKAATDKHGCGLTDSTCQCTTAFKTTQEAVANCVMATKPCTDADLAKMSATGAKICYGDSRSSSTSNSTSGTKPTAAVVSSSASASSGAGGAKPAAGPTSSHNAASPERTFAAGAFGLVGAVVALAL